MKYSIITLGCFMNTSDSERIHSIMSDLGFIEVKNYLDTDLLIVNTCSIKQKAEDKAWGFVGNISKLKRKNKNIRIGITGCMVRETGYRKQGDGSREIGGKQQTLDERQKMLVSQLVSWSVGQLVSNKEVDPLMKKHEYLDFVFRIEDLNKLPFILKEVYGSKIVPKDNLVEKIHEFSHEEIDQSYFQIIPKSSDSFRALIPIQTGCNKFCTYCIVPFSRKREVCRPMNEILDEIKIAISKGAKEIYLLGQTVNSYFSPKLKVESLKEKKMSVGQLVGWSVSQKHLTQNHSKSDFVELLYLINQIEGVERIRYSSPHPMDFSDELIQAHVDLPKLCNHIHLPLQSGDNEILKKMNRKYTRERYLEVVERIRKKIPNCAITTDIIVGFCGETGKQFQNTLDLFRQVEFDMSFNSQYSPRKGTYAEKFLKDDISKEEKNRRWHEINNLLIEISLKKNKEYEGKIEPILVERKLKNGDFEGMTRSFKRTQFSILNLSAEALAKEDSQFPNVANSQQLDANRSIQFSSKKDIKIGDIVDVKITSAKEFVIKGETV